MKKPQKTFPTRCAGRLLLAAALALSAGHALAQEPDFAAPGRELFLNGLPDHVNCAACHTLAHAGSTGEVGPNLNELDGLSPDRIQKAVREGLGPMPPFTWLSDEQVDLLARYVNWASQQQ